MTYRCDYCNRLVPEKDLASYRKYYSVKYNEVVCKRCADELEALSDSRWLKSQLKKREQNGN